MADSGHILSLPLKWGTGLAVTEEGIARWAQTAVATLEVVALVAARLRQLLALVDICRGRTGVTQGRSRLTDACILCYLDLPETLCLTCCTGCHCTSPLLCPSWPPCLCSEAPPQLPNTTAPSGHLGPFYSVPL